MLNLSDIRDKEVINVVTGERLGYIDDFEIDLDKGIITAIILPTENKVMNIFAKKNDLYIDWKNIYKIGSDIILVNLNVE